MSPENAGAVKTNIMDAPDTTAAAGRLADVRAKIAAAARRGGRSSEDVTLVAVSKTFPPGAITPVLDAGHREFGENRVQEAEAKWPELKARYPDVRLHLIGPLQSNKAREAVALFDVIHSLDRPKIARAIASEAERTGRHPEVFIQVNTGDEPQKAGCKADELPDLVDLCRDELGLDLRGLMCIPPVEDEPAIHFAFLAKLAAQHGLAGLSMGMSADYETAISLGATHVRVGSAIFGPRAKP